MRASRASSHRRSGFTLIELVTVTVLATLLMILLSLTWTTFGRPALEVEARARIAREAILASQSLACDLGGFLADLPGRTGTLAQYSFVDWDLTHGDVLLLNFRGADPRDVVVISYHVSGTQLLRTNSSIGATATIANHVTGFSVEPNPEDASQAAIQITIAFRSFTANYRLIGVRPS